MRTINTSTDSYSRETPPNAGSCSTAKGEPKHNYVNIEKVCYPNELLHVSVDSRQGTVVVDSILLEPAIWVEGVGILAEYVFMAIISSDGCDEDRSFLHGEFGQCLSSLGDNGTVQRQDFILFSLPELVVHDGVDAKRFLL